MMRGGETKKMTVGQKKIKKGQGKRRDKWDGREVVETDRNEDS